MAKIITDFTDGIATITLNNDEKRNSLSPDLLISLIGEFVLLKEKNTRVVIIRANKEAKIWSAGFDIASLPEPGKDPLAFFDPLERLLRHIQRFPAPVIAMIDGSVRGGACDMAFICDLIIGSPNATFAITPAKIGVPYNSSGIIHFINAVGLPVAKQMFYTAQPIDAQKAFSLGIINYVVESDKIEDFTHNLARQITNNSPLAISVIKEQLRVFSISKPISPESYELIDSLRSRAYNSKDYVEGKKAFLEKRKPVFTGE